MFSPLVIAPISWAEVVCDHQIMYDNRVLDHKRAKRQDPRFLLRKYAMMLLCMFLFSLQGEVRPEPTDIKVDFTETVTMVSLPLKVTRGGEPYKDLELDMLQIVENGVQVVPAELQLVKSPLTLHFLFDLSTSNERHIFLAKKAARGLVGKMKPGDRSKVSFFSSSYQPLTAYTSDQEELARSLSYLTPVGSTALYDGIASALKDLRSVSGARVLVLFTDGHDLMSRMSENDLMAAVRNYRIPIIFVRFGDRDMKGKALLQAQVQFMDQMAKESGGETLRILSSSKRDIAKSVKAFRSRYMVRFRPPGPDNLEQWRSLVLRISDCPDCDLEYRRAYSISTMNSKP